VSAVDADDKPQLAVEPFVGYRLFLACKFREVGVFTLTREHAHSGAGVPPSTNPAKSGASMP
jgi:hypothetical protein